MTFRENESNLPKCTNNTIRYKETFIPKYKILVSLKSKEENKKEIRICEQLSEFVRLQILIVIHFQCY